MCPGPADDSVYGIFDGLAWGSQASAATDFRPTKYGMPLNATARGAQVDGLAKEAHISDFCLNSVSEVLPQGGKDDFKQAWADMAELAQGRSCKGCFHKCCSTQTALYLAHRSTQDIMNQADTQHMIGSQATFSFILMLVIGAKSAESTQKLKS